MPEAGSQMALDIRLNTRATFETYDNGANAAAVAELRRLSVGSADSHQLYLWGGASTGKSHLVQAACQQAAGCGLTSSYLPLAGLRDMPPELLAGMGEVRVVGIDDLDCILGSPAWERALFQLVNTVRDRGHRLILASRPNPTRLSTSLPDLASRLCWGPVYRLQSLDDDGKCRALRCYADQAGLHLSDEAARYLLSHCHRDMGHLRAVLDRLDRASMQTQRRLTVPFIRSVLKAE